MTNIDTDDTKDTINISDDFGNVENIYIKENIDTCDSFVTCDNMSLVTT